MIEMTGEPMVKGSKTAAPTLATATPNAVCGSVGPLLGAPLRSAEMLGWRNSDAAQLNHLSRLPDGSEGPGRLRNRHAPILDPALGPKPGPS
jgi:hypothetical protein